jgi:hypothetical protein
MLWFLHKAKAFLLFLTHFYRFICKVIKENILFLFSVVSLMIDRLHPELCAVLISTGQLNVIHLVSGDTVFHR